MSDVPAAHWAVILAGGIGSRFWPASTPRRPKQLLPLVDDAPLLVNTVTRLLPLVGAKRILILTNASLTRAITSLLPDIPRANILAEPRSASTAPALAWAASEIVRRVEGGRQAVMLCVHSDWAIADPEEFRSTLLRAADVAERFASLVTVGVVPTRPDPGFGYIQPGRALNGEGARRVRRFVEKPNRPRAQRMVRAGYLWNSGIFVWRAGDFLDEVQKLAPEVAKALPQLASGNVAKFFEKVTPISVDQGVLERSERVLVLPGDFGWDDVGTWSALRRVRALDREGNASSGPAHFVSSNDNVVHAEAGGNSVVLYGVSDMVVVSTDGLTLVTTTEHATDLKKLVESLPAQLRDRS